MNKFILLITIIFTLFSAPAVFSSQLKIYVSEINATGMQNKDEMKTTLQILLASRLTNEQIVTVGSVSEADIVVTGTYITIGKIFSVDALAKNRSGKIVTRAFMQGEGQDDLIPAVGKLAEKLSAELLKNFVPVTQKTGTDILQSTASSASSSIIRSGNDIKYSENNDIIRSDDHLKESSDSWISKRLPGVANHMVIGETLSNGDRAIFLAYDNKLQYFRQGQETVLKLIASTDFRTTEKIISLDIADSDGDGNQEIFVTIIRNSELFSQIWELKNDKFNKIVSDIPYYFRSLALAGGAKKLYAQQMGRGEDDFYGNIYEVTRAGGTIKLGNTIKMPRYGNIYSFNQFRTKEGNIMTVVINPDNYLIVYDRELKEIWRSPEKFGGSSLYFQREDSTNIQTTGDKFRWVFLNQQIQVTSNNDIIVGKNSGFFVLGNARSYTKGAIYSMKWDGSGFEEKWRTKEIQSYIPDFLYDEHRNELLILQIPQKAGIMEEGATSIAIKKVE